MPTPPLARNDCGRMNAYDRVYRWGNNARRAELRGRRCRIVARGALGSVLVELEDGERVVTSRRAVRRAERGS